jgi:hypothetical protein
MHPGLDVAFRPSISGDGTPGNGAVSDEAHVVVLLGNLVDDTDAALEDGEIDDDEYARLCAAIDTVNEAVNRVSADLAELRKQQDSDNGGA